ncbi:hypothetical protein ACVWXU_008695 [Streptomyces sp. TE33382]
MSAAPTQHETPGDGARGLAVHCDVFRRFNDRPWPVSRPFHPEPGEGLAAADLWICVESGFLNWGFVV